LVTPLLACLVALMAVLVPYVRYRGEILEFSPYQLPAFDPYVYVAMAEHPSFFTVAPWGYRVLTPWIVHALGLPNVVQGYRLELVAGLTLAGALLFYFLRALGHATVPALAAVVVFGVSPPVVECVRSVFVTEPFTVALEIGFLLAVQTGTSVPLLSLLLTLLASSKEIWVLLLPLVYLAARGSARARALATLAAGLPPLAVAVALRRWWIPHIVTPHPHIGTPALAAALRELRTTWPETWPGLVLYGVTPLAVAGLLHPEGRAYARRYGALALALTAVALTASVNIPSRTFRPLFGANTTRLMLFVLPLLLPLALFALDRLYRSWRRPPPPAPARPRLAAVAAVGVAACVAFPFVALDRYRRVPLHERRYGPLVLAVCRETLRTARRLEAGRRVTFDLSAEGEGDPSDSLPVKRIRWFLRDGWGGDPAFASGPVRTTADEATLLLPCLRPRPVAVTLGVDAAAGERLDVLVNRKIVGRWREGVALIVPAETLFRGDNILTLHGRAGAAQLRSVSYDTRVEVVGP
jgi:hypothetical protein